MDSRYARSSPRFKMLAPSPSDSDLRHWSLHQGPLSLMRKPSASKWLNTVQTVLKQSMLKTQGITSILVAQDHGVIVRSGNRMTGRYSPKKLSAPLLKSTLIEVL